MVKITVLLVEDNLTIRKIISYSLMRLGINVVEASDGVEAIEKLYFEKPDLVLLDVNIQKLSVYAVCTQIKSDPQTEHIPVILCTSKNQQNDYHEAKKYGVNGYLSQPFKKSEIMTIISELGITKLKVSENKSVPTLKKSSTMRFITLDNNNYIDVFAYS